MKPLGEVRVTVEKEILSGRVESCGWVCLVGYMVLKLGESKDMGENRDVKNGTVRHVFS